MELNDKNTPPASNPGLSSIDSNGPDLRIDLDVVNISVLRSLSAGAPDI